MPYDVNSTFIALIPKMNEAISFSNFIPISLCNFLYKIMANVMANRLRPILPLIINPNQGDFVTGHQILDGIILAHELTHSSHMARRDGMLLKLDINKAYDYVDWDFLMQVLKKFRFNDELRNLVLACVSSTSFLVLMNIGILPK